MRSRGIALLLAFVLLWCGLTTHESSLAIAMTAAPQALLGAGEEPAQRVDAGSVESHHLDDLPAQVLAEHLTDPPALAAMNVDAAPADLGAGRPRPVAAATWLPPYLGGPLRPPRATAPLA